MNQKVYINREPVTSVNKFDYPAWTKQGFKQCRNCSLDTQQNSHCPVAIDVMDIIVGCYKEILSDRVTNILFITQEREYFKYCDAQTGLRALIGLVMATSRCPILSKMRGLAHYHLPFTSIDDEW